MYSKYYLNTINTLGGLVKMICIFMPFIFSCIILGGEDEKMEKKKETYDRNMAVLSEFSSRFRGLDKAVSIVESLLD